MQSTQEAKNDNTSETIDSLNSKLEDVISGPLQNISTKMSTILDEISATVKRIQIIHDKKNITDEDDNDITKLENEYKQKKQEFNELYYQNGNKDDKIKTFQTIKHEIDEMKETLSNKIKTEMDSIWDDKEKKFKKETKYWWNFLSSKPTQSDLEKQKSSLLAKGNAIDNLDKTDMNNIAWLHSCITNQQVKFEQLLADLNSYKEQKKQEEERRRQEEEKKKQEEEEKKKIPPHEIKKIITWLKTTSDAKSANEESVIKMCRKFGVNNYDDFKIAMSKDTDIEKMQAFFKNDRDIVLSKEQCIELLERYDMKTFEEFREKLSQGAQEIVDTIDDNGANKIRDKLQNEAQNISDYVNYMNSLANNQQGPLIKKVNIDLLQAQADSLKKKLGEKNIFIKFLMLFGYDPGGLVTAYHIAKNKLKEAKWKERNNLLNNSENNFINNNSECSKMYSGNKSVTNNNNIALFGQQSIQQVNNSLGY